MNKIDWKRKLTSRKLWAVITAVAICSLEMAGAESGTIERVVALIGVIASLVSYIVFEGLADVKALDVKKLAEQYVKMFKDLIGDNHDDE